MVFGFFAVVGKRYVYAFFRQHYRCCRRQNNAFIGWAEQHIELHAAGNNGLGVKLRQLQSRCAVIEQTGIEKIRRLTAGLGRKFAEFQHVLCQSEFEEVLTEIGHLGSPERC